jgi:ACS family allantoate permease-like MFS transporter
MGDVEKINDASSEDPEKVTELSPEPTIDNGVVKDVRHMHADFNDGDVALKAFAGHEGEVIVMTPEQEKALLRKIDWNLMPVWFICSPYLP